MINDKLATSKVRTIFQRECNLVISNKLFFDDIIFDISYKDIYIYKNNGRLVGRNRDYYNLFCFYHKYGIVYKKCMFLESFSILKRGKQTSSMFFHRIYKKDCMSVYDFINNIEPNYNDETEIYAYFSCVNEILRILVPEFRDKYYLFCLYVSNHSNSTGQIVTAYKDLYKDYVKILFDKIH